MTKNDRDFDTHTHLNVDHFNGKEDEELALAKELGVSYHNVVGFDQETIDQALALADAYREVYATIGWPPD
ncbi:TatD family hydrolase [Streptococcus equi]|uniref:TatD family hydrolase n=1 Tax=Streptococcus equi TaxID=1336 RepID=UPI0039C74B24